MLEARSLPGMFCRAWGPAYELLCTAPAGLRAFPGLRMPVCTSGHPSQNLDYRKCRALGAKKALEQWYQLDLSFPVKPLGLRALRVCPSISHHGLSGYHLLCSVCREDADRVKTLKELQI